MKRITSIKINILILGFFLALSLILTTNLISNMGISNTKSEDSDGIIFENEYLKRSKYSGKIHIDNNWTDAWDVGICTGNGTYFDPYIIEDLVINGGCSGSCILIENSDVYFRIENCTVYNSGIYPNAGIRLANVSNSLLIENNCSLHGRGIYLYRSNNNIIFGNIADNSISGVGLYYGNNNIISGNNVNYNDYGILLDYSDSNTIVGNTANHNQRGIYLLFSDKNNATTNNVSYNDEYGIYLLSSDNNLISGNTLIGNGECIVEEFCEGNIFENNDCGKGDKEPVIHGYNLFFLIGILSIVAFFISKKVKKN